MCTVPLAGSWNDLKLRHANFRTSRRHKYRRCHQQSGCRFCDHLLCRWETVRNIRRCVPRFTAPSSITFESTKWLNVIAFISTFAWTECALERASDINSGPRRFAQGVLADSVVSPFIFTLAMTAFSREILFFPAFSFCVDIYADDW